MQPDIKSPFPSIGFTWKYLTYMDSQGNSWQEKKGLTKRLTDKDSLGNSLTGKRTD